MTQFNSQEERRDHFALFEKQGEAAVRIEVNKGHWQETNRIMLGFAMEWLRQKDESRSLEASLKRDQREEETLKIARQAQSEAQRANRIAVASIVIAAIFAIIAAYVGRGTS